MNAGGAETFLMKLYRNIDREKYQMDFCVTVKERGVYDDEIEALGGRIYRITSKSDSLVKFRRQLKHVVRDNGYRHVMRVTSTAMGFMDLCVAKRAGAQVCIARSSNSSDGGGLRSRLMHRLGGILYKKYVDVRIAPSDLAAIYTFGKDVYEGGGVSILHNAVDMGTYGYSHEGRQRVRAELGIGEGVRVIGHVGRLTHQKNHMFLLDVFKRIVESEPESVLMLVGKGELESLIRDRVTALGIEKNVIFTGVRSDVPSLMSAMDVFVFPSFYEGMPNTVIEAQATGLACVVADTITREANITGLVEYLPLGDADMWARTALGKQTDVRETPRDAFERNGYDIGAVARQFEGLVFGNEDVND